MTSKSANNSSWRLLGDVSLILLFGAAVITILVAAWAQPIRENIKKHAPDVLLHQYLDHQKPHVPRLPKL